MPFYDNQNIVIRSTNTNHPLGCLVQDYANRHYNAGFYHGLMTGSAIGIFVTIVVLCTK